MFRVTEIKRICWACPSQWEGKTVDGDPVSVHYRWGTLTIQVGTKVVFSKHIGKPTTEEDDKVVYDSMRRQGWDEGIIARIKCSTDFQRQNSVANGETPLCFDGLISYKELRKQVNNICEFPENEG